MSRHHMLLPLTFVPLPPKTIENRRRRIHAGEIFEEVDEMTEAGDASGAGRPTAASVALAPLNFPTVEGSERKPQNPAGRLSESTLKAMLQAQELK